MEVNSDVCIAEIPSHGDGYDSWMLSDDKNYSSKNKKGDQEAEVVKNLKKSEHQKKPSYIEVL